jgi:PAS domain S-box-containing protein
MNQLYTRRNIIIGLSIFLAFIAFFAWHAFHNMKKNATETRIVNTRLQSLRAMEELMDDMQDIETGSQGYILSRNKQFLGPYYLALKDLKQDTVLLKALYPVFPQRKNVLERLLGLVKRKTDFSISSVEPLIRDNKGPAYSQVQSGIGQQIMDSIRQIIFSLENEDRKVLQLSNKQREVSAAITARLFAVLAGIFIVMLLLLFLLSHLDLKRRDINEKKIVYLADIAEQASDAIILGDKNFNIISWNKGAEEMYGYAKEEAIGKKYQLVLDSRKLDKEKQKTGEILKAAEYFSGELEYKSKNGQSIFVQASFTVLKDRDRRITGYSIIHRDITEKKKAEKSLREFNEKLNNEVQAKIFESKEALERFRIITRATNDVVWDADLKNGSVWWNDNFYEKFGYRISDGASSPHFWDDHIHPDDKDRVLGHIDTILNDSKASMWGNEYRFRKADNSYVNIYDRSHVMRDENGEAYRMIGSMADVTDLFIVRKELNQSEEKYRTLVEQATDGIFVSDQYGKFLLVNSSACKLSGYSKDELMGMSIYDLVNKKDLMDHPFHMDELKEGKNVITERIITSKEGRPLPIEVNAKMLSDGRMLVFIRDITEKKKAEEEIEKSNARFLIISKATSDIVWDWNLLDDSLWWNDNYYLNLGYSKKNEIVHINEWYNRMHKDDVARIKEKIKKAFIGNDSVWRDEYRYAKPDGSYLNFLDRGHIMRDNEGKAYRMIGSMADITDLFLIREELKKSETRYHSLVEQAADAIALFDNKGKILEVNNSVLYLLGYSYVELMKMSLTDILTADEISTNPVQYDLLEKGESTLKQRKMRRKDGSTVITEVNSKILPDGRFLSMVRDLTDRIEAQKQIEKEKELSDNIIAGLPGVFYFFDENGKFIRWNKQFEIVTGYTAKEISEMHPLQFFEGDDVKYIEQSIGKVFLEGISDAEANFVFKNGDKKPYFFKAILVDFEGRPCLLGTGFDISDRKKAEKDLNESYTAIRKLTGHLQNVREEDRAHIAREIHDELGQQLTVLKMDISWINKKINTTDDLVKEKMKGLLSMLDETVNTVRRISSELRPSLLDDLGLIAAMEWQLEEFKKRSDIKTSFIAPEKEVEFSDMVKTGLFRIFQESLTNVIRHSEAKKLKVSLGHIGNNFVLTIADDGKGFDKEKIADKRTLGILGMKERTSMIGGTYKITSIPGEGTTVVVSVPINEQH